MSEPKGPTRAAVPGTYRTTVEEAEQCPSCAGAGRGPGWRGCTRCKGTGVVWRTIRTKLEGALPPASFACAACADTRKMAVAKTVHPSGAIPCPFCARGWRRR